MTKEMFSVKTTDGVLEVKQGDTVLVGGQSKTGRTTFIIDAMIAAVREGKEVLFVNTEVRVTDLVAKITERAGEEVLDELQDVKLLHMEDGKSLFKDEEALEFLEDVTSDDAVVIFDNGKKPELTDLLDYAKLVDKGYTSIVGLTLPDNFEYDFSDLTDMKIHMVRTMVENRNIGVLEGFKYITKGAGA